VDVKTNLSVHVPGSGLYYDLDRDPYADLVSLATDLGADGIDLDYEEFWHADYFREGPRPYSLWQTVYKFTAIVKDTMVNIQQQNPSLRLSHAAGATAAWTTNWWGGNMKGLVYHMQTQFPETVNFITVGPNAGGFNVMTYDLSDDESSEQCPLPGVCTLDQQVNFFMQAYANVSIPASVGYEVGVPAFPDPEFNPQHALPLTETALALIIKNTQGPLAPAGGFLWEVYKPNTVPGYANATQVAQAICNTLLPGNSRCMGQLPYVNTTM
jgi:hypothetical protein